MAIKWENFGNALQAMGAGLQGQLPAYMAAQARQKEQANQEQERQRMDMAHAARQTRLMLESGQTGQAQSFLMNRLNDIQQRGGDPTHTADVYRMLSEGRIDDALNDARQAEQMAVGRGYLKPLQGPEQKIVDGQLITLDGGRATASPIEGFQQDAGKQQDRDLRRREVELAESREERMANEIKGPAMQALLRSQDRVVEAQREANKYTVLANDFERHVEDAGAVASFNEWIKGALGTQDDVTEFRRQFNAIRSSQAVRNLPPGVASDKDVELALRGFPTANANPSQISSFLRGLARLSRFDAAYNQFKADYISERRSPAGLNRAWRQQIQVPSLDRRVSVGEIYETAIDMGITVEDVRKQLGI